MTQQEIELADLLRQALPEIGTIYFASPKMEEQAALRAKIGAAVSAHDLDRNAIYAEHHLLTGSSAHTLLKRCLTVLDEPEDSEEFTAMKHQLIEELRRALDTLPKSPADRRDPVWAEELAKEDPSKRLARMTAFWGQP